MTALFDTGFLLAVLDADDEFHKVCTEVLLNEPQPLFRPKHSAHFEILPRLSR